MKTTKKSGRAAARTRPAARKESPLTPDELLLHDNVPPSEHPPEDVARHLSTESIIISSPDAQLDPERYIARVPGEKAVWRIELPENATVGLHGRCTERFAAGALAKHSAHRIHADAYRPPWAGQVFHPKQTVEPRLRMMRSLAGRRVTPHYGLYGNDDRRVFYPAGYPWQCIGKVFTYANNRLLGTGAGVLVGPRHVLTAGHMVPWGQPVWGMQFVPGYYDGSSVSGPGATSWVSDAQGWNTGNQVAARDMAVLRLYDPLGGWLGWFGSKTYDDDWEDEPYWEMVGYPGDVAGAQRPSYELGISVLDDDSDGDALELEHHGDSTPGDSGGPFFSFWPDGFPYVIGTTSGGENISGGFLGIGDEDNNIAAGGAAMVNLINWARNTWP